MSRPQAIVTTVFTRDVAPSVAPQFEEWLHGVSTELSGFTGNLGTTIIRPDSLGGRYHAIIAFRDEERLEEWLGSKQRAIWLARLSAIGVAEVRTDRSAGTQRWFSDSGSAAPPAKYKVATLLIAGLFPIVTGLQMLSQSLLATVPSPIRTLVTLSISVGLMVWLVMPWLTKIANGWLYPTHRKTNRPE